MITNDYIKNAKKTPEFLCVKCSFKCAKKSDYNRHLLTRKHKMITNDYKKTPKNATPYYCVCGKAYKHRQGLYAHKKKCNFVDEENIEMVEEKEDKTDIDNSSIKEMFLTMMNENKELKNMLKTQQDNHDKQLMEIIPKIGNNTNSFNIQIFLNEKCKDALNINDFLEGIQLQLKDLDKMNEIGYVNGITRIFMDGLNKLELNKRPLHCSDAKREILYVKDNDAWERDDKKEKLNKAIATVGRKTLQHFPEWMKEHPDCNNTNSTENNNYHLLIKNTVAQNTEDNKKKVAKNIIKEIIIDK